VGGTCFEGMPRSANMEEPSERSVRRANDTEYSANRVVHVAFGKVFAGVWTAFSYQSPEMPQAAWPSRQGGAEGSDSTQAICSLASKSRCLITNVAGADGPA